MTKYLEGDETRTSELVEQLEDDSSWLRHTDRAGELDRRLLFGAFEDELAEVRPDWRNHVRHLRRDHRLDVRADERGVWRVIGAAPGPVPFTDPSFLETQPVGNADSAVGDAPAPSDGGPVSRPALRADQSSQREFTQHLTSAPKAESTRPDAPRICVTAKAIAAFARLDILHDQALRDSVAMLIRQASESSHWHNCADFRSQAAADLVSRQEIRTAHQYQAWCRSNLHHEHIVPGKVIYDLLRQVDATDEAAVRILISRLSLRATITFDEEHILRQAGLRSSMPAAFYKVGDILFLDPLARYKETGLFAQLEQRRGALWFED